MKTSYVTIIKYVFCFYTLFMATSLFATGNFSCHRAINLKCGYSLSHDTKYGHSESHNYSCFHSSQTGYHAKEIIVKLDMTGVGYNHDIEITLSDNKNRGLDVFFLENCGKFDQRCLAYKENFGQNYKVVIKNPNPDKAYYIVIDAKSITGDFFIRTKCKKRLYACHNAKEVWCGRSVTGNTANGENNYADYRCFDKRLYNFYAKELIYKITNRSDFVEDISITFEDLDDRGLDLFILKNCGRNDYECHSYVLRNTLSSPKHTFDIRGALPQDDYYIIVDAKSRDNTGRFRLDVKCANTQLHCEKAIDIPCGNTVSGDTKHGHAINDDYWCANFFYEGFFAKELIYKISNRPHTLHDIDITMLDLDNQGLDLFVLEDCGKDFSKCITAEIRTVADPDGTKVTLFNTDPDKDYYIVIDAKRVTGRFKLTVQCDDGSIQCHDATEIHCGQTIQSSGNNSSTNYSDLTCFDSKLSNLPSGGEMYNLSSRPGEKHDIEIHFNDYDQKGLDIFVFENCGTNNSRCLAQFRRSESSPQRKVFKILDADPNKHYSILIKNADGDQGRYSLGVFCEPHATCTTTCFEYTRNPNGRFNFLFPHENLSGEEAYQWQFQNDKTGETITHAEGDLMNLHLSSDALLWRVALLDKDHNEICFLYIQVGNCSQNEIKAEFSFTRGECSLDFPASSCNIHLDASTSFGIDLIYHWFFFYKNEEYNRKYVSFSPDTLVGLAYPDSLTSITLVITGSCGMSSVSWQGSCLDPSRGEYNIDQGEENEVTLTMGNFPIPCTTNVVPVRVDWGDGTISTFDYYADWDDPGHLPKHKYNQAGTYIIKIALNYRCSEKSGDFMDLNCAICLSYSINLGDLPNDNNCQFVGITKGDYQESSQQITLSYNHSPPGYTFSHYIELLENSPREIAATSFFEAGKTYELGALYKSDKNAAKEFWCTRPITIDYPPQELIVEVDKVCGSPGETVEIPIRTENFENVTGLQFRIGLENTEIAQLLEVDQLNDSLPIQASDISLDKANGRLQFAWTSTQSDQAKSLPDGSVLFVLKAEIKSTETDTSALQVSHGMAFNNLQNRQIHVNAIHGFICVFASQKISGTVLDMHDTHIEDALVYLNGVPSGQMQTSTDGRYVFEGLSFSNYTVGVQKDDDIREGLNVVDLALLQSYNRSFGEAGLTSPYQLLAANLVKALDNQTISVADETELRRLISYDIDQLSEYSSPWIFVPVTENLATPPDFNAEVANTYEYQPLEQDMENQDFVGIKIGDLDGSFGRSNNTKRSSAEINLSFDTTEVEEGDIINVPLRLTGSNNIQNMQFTMHWNESVLEYVGYESALDELQITDASFSTRFVNNGKLTFVHSLAPNAVDLQDTILFHLSFRALGEPGAESILEIISDPVEALITNSSLEAYSLHSDPGLVQIKMSTSTSDVAFSKMEVGKAFPNPFTDYFSIPLNISSTQDIVVSIYNKVGQRLHTQNFRVVPGKQSIDVSGDFFETTGTYYYQLMTMSGIYSDSIIFVEK